MTVLVDSDVLIEVSREKDPDILSRWETLGRSDGMILYSPVTAAELWAGVRPPEHEALAALLQALVCVPIDRETGRRAGDYLRQFRKSHGLALGDGLIAAAAVLNRASLWTKNRKHFPMKELTFY
ncbi:MAG: type II toxin-antitoxin system VapC family toxin [Terriglobales bacterium]|jgi:predicted nucleic acid-binding protein